MKKNKKTVFTGVVVMFAIVVVLLLIIIGLLLSGQRENTVENNLSLFDEEVLEDKEGVENEDQEELNEYKRVADVLANYAQSLKSAEQYVHETYDIRYADPHGVTTEYTIVEDYRNDNYEACNETIIDFMKKTDLYTEEFIADFEYYMQQINDYDSFNMTYYPFVPHLRDYLYSKNGIYYTAHRNGYFEFIDAYFTTLGDKEVLFVKQSSWCLLLEECGDGRWRICHTFNLIPNNWASEEDYINCFPEKIINKDDYVRQEGSVGYMLDDECNLLIISDGSRPYNEQIVFERGEWNL